jgi:hypothetical protein
MKNIRHKQTYEKYEKEKVGLVFRGFGVQNFVTSNAPNLLCNQLLKCEKWKLWGFKCKTSNINKLPKNAKKRRWDPHFKVSGFRTS